MSKLRPLRRSIYLPVRRPSLLLRSRRSEQSIISLPALNSRSIGKVTCRQDRPGNQSLSLCLVKKPLIFFSCEWTSLDIGTDVGPSMSDLPDRAIAELIGSIRHGETIVFRCTATLLVDRQDPIFLGLCQRSRKREKNYIIPLRNQCLPVRIRSVVSRHVALCTHVA